MIASGMLVELELIDDLDRREMLRVQIVPDAFADLDRGFLGDSTPLARAISGHAAGERITYSQADIRAVQILAVRVAEIGPDPSVKRRREEIYRSAVDQAEKTNAVLFASSFNGKWRDYDPASLNAELEQDRATPDSMQNDEEH